MKPISLAIWGLHHQHPPWYCELFKHMPQYDLRCLCDSDRAFITKRAAILGVPGCADPDALLARDDIELVIVSTPHVEMPDAARRCLAAGKHVLVEKPLGTSAAAVREIVTAAERTGLIATTAFYFRYHPAAGKIRQWLADGLLGQLTRFDGYMWGGSPARYLRDHAPWMLDDRQRGGPLFNLGMHWIDLLWYLTGARVCAVHGTLLHTGGDPPRTIEDAAAVILEYDSGATAALDFSYGLPSGYPAGRNFFLRLRGSLGLVEWHVGYGPEDEILLASDHPSVGENCLQRVRVPLGPQSGYGGPMGRDFFIDLAAAIREGRQPPVTAADGLRAVTVVEAARLSAERGNGLPTEMGAEGPAPVKTGAANFPGPINSLRDN